MNSNSFDENNDSIPNNQVYIQQETKNFELGNGTEERNDSTNFTDSPIIVKNLTNRGLKNIEAKTKGKKKKDKLLGKKRKIFDIKKISKNKSNNKYKRFDVQKKIMTYYEKFLLKKLKLYCKQSNIKKIPYKIKTQGNKKYLMCVFKGTIYSYFNQEIENNRPNEKILQKLIKNTKIKQFLEKNFLEVFYNDFVKILNKTYSTENKNKDKKFYDNFAAILDKKISKEELKIWEKIIYYNSKTKKKTESKNKYQNYGFYQLIEETNGRETLYEYKLIENKDNNLSPNSNINNNLSSKSENKENNISLQDENSESHSHSILSLISNLSIDNSIRLKKESFDSLNMDSNNCSYDNLFEFYENAMDIPENGIFD